MRFREWLKFQEAGTTTADVAVFSRPIFQVRGRQSPPLITFGEEDPFFKRKKKPSVENQQHIP